MRIRVTLCIVLAMLLTVLTGCWNRKELSTLAINEAFGIDRTDDGQIMLTVQLLKPGEVKAPSGGKSGGGGGGGGKAVWIVTTTGKNLFEATRNVTLQSDRRLLGSFTKVIVIGEAVARSGIKPLLDFYDRDHENRRLTYVFVARGKAKDIIEAEHGQEKIPAKAIEGLAKVSASTSEIPKVNLHDVMKTLSSKTSDPYMPGVEIFKQNIDGQVKNMIRMDDTAVFKKDRLTGWLDKKATRGLLWVTGKVKSGVITVPAPKEETGNVGIEILRSSSNVKAKMIDGKPAISVNIKEEANITVEMVSVDFSKLENFEELEKRQEAAIKNEIDAAIKKAQEWGVDIFKFGEEIHRKYPKEWKKLKTKWDTEFRNLRVEVKVEAQIRRIGMITRPD